MQEINKELSVLYIQMSRVTPNWPVVWVGGQLRFLTQEIHSGLAVELSYMARREVM